MTLPDDSGEVPKLNLMVGDSIVGREIIPLLDIKLATWSSASYIPINKLKKVLIH